MRRSLSHLRGALFGTAVAISLGFGASQALAAPAAAARFASCPYSPNGPYFYGPCETDCVARGYDFGFCRYGSCVCRDVTPPS